MVHDGDFGKTDGMKMLFATGIYPPDVGGPATYTRGMARAFHEKGHEVAVICYADASQVALPNEESFPVIRVSRDRSLRKRYREYEEKAFQLAKEMDIVYLQGPVSEGYPGTRAAKRAKKPTVMKVVGDYAWEVYMQSGKLNKKKLLDEFVTHRHRMSPKIYALERIERETAKYARHVITPSVYLKGIVERWGVPSDRISVIYNEVQAIPDGLSRDDARREFNADGKRVLFYAGRAVPWKNIDFIIRLLPKLNDPTIRFVIAGDGPSLASWKEGVTKAGVQDRVLFLGPLDRKALGEWYRAADLFVLPSGYEGFPNVVAEAVSAGLPVFVSDRGGNPETYPMYGSNAIRVLPYLDETKWLYALQVDWPKRMQPIPHTQTMIASTEALLQRLL